MVTGRTRPTLTSGVSGERAAAAWSLEERRDISVAAEYPNDLQWLCIGRSITRYECTVHARKASPARSSL